VQQECRHTRQQKSVILDGNLGITGGKTMLTIVVYLLIAGVIARAARDLYRSWRDKEFVDRHPHNHHWEELYSDDPKPKDYL
jgi:hypothetical protein